MVFSSHFIKVKGNPKFRDICIIKEETWQKEERDVHHREGTTKSVYKLPSKKWGPPPNSFPSLADSFFVQ